MVQGPTKDLAVIRLQRHDPGTSPCWSSPEHSAVHLLPVDDELVCGLQGAGIGSGPNYRPGREHSDVELLAPNQTRRGATKVRLLPWACLTTVSCIQGVVPGYGQK